MAWLSIWYHNKPISHHKPAGLGALAQQHPRQTQPGTVRSKALSLLQFKELLQLLHRLLGTVH